MKIWIIRDGEKVGPMQEFEVRKRIHNGEFNEYTPAWHEGLSEWEALGDIGIFEREFDSSAFEPEPSPYTPPNTSTSASPPPLEASAYLRRFLARWFDLYFYAGFWWLGMWLAHQNIKAALFNPWIHLAYLISWFLIESILLHCFSTTLGKWLLGLRVVNQDGSRLELGPASKRSLHVFILGIGLGWYLLVIICQVLSLFIARRLGSTFWDHVGKHRVTAAPHHPPKIALFVAIFIGSIFLQASVTSPYAREVLIEQYPEFKEHLANPFWHLPRR